MNSSTFEYIWAQAIRRGADIALGEVEADECRAFNAAVEDTSGVRQKVFCEYNRIRMQVRERYFNTGKNNDKKIDKHKICACLMGALLRVPLIKFNKDMSREVSDDLAMSKYRVAMYSALGTLYLCMASDAARADDKHNLLCGKLIERATLVFPETCEGHDDYLTGKIKTLALNDIWDNDYDVLLWADTLFWIEKYNWYILSCEN